jgi:hypothetical protein
MQHGRSGEQKSSVSILVQLFSIFRPIAAEPRSAGPAECNSAATEDRSSFRTAPTS